MLLGLRVEPHAPAFQEFLSEHGDELVGELHTWVQEGCAAVEYRHGLISTLRLTPWSTAEALAYALEAVFHAPGLIRLQTLEVGALESNGSFDRLWNVLPSLPTLETLSVGTLSRPHGDEHQISWLWLGAVGQVMARCPRLRARL